ncbi:MAG: metalloregulator ArsR/SmtB family transcription factor [Alphaproteobacteria bacterium]|nr:metalloregulator ArsR/SmtB family transcription factor [Alphaproteobacteria bacterium]
MELTDALKALSNDTRLQILQWLKDPDRNFTAQEVGDFHREGVCVTKIQEKARMSQSTVSQYLAILQKAGLVKAQRIGQWTFYKRDDANIRKLLKAMKQEI